MNEPTQNNQRKIWFWVAGIIIVGLISLILIVILKTKNQANLSPQINATDQTNSSQTATTAQTNLPTEISTSTQINAAIQANTSTPINTLIPTYVVAGIPTCTSFTYSEWSICSSNGTQTRTIIKALPENCHNGNPILSQNCIYKPATYTPTPAPTLTPSKPADLASYQRMINQIKAAPNQTISTTYTDGANNKNTTILTWQIKNDGLYLSVRGYETANPKNQSTMSQIDTNFDGKPERIADNGLPFVDILPSHQYYKEILVAWATFMSYFEKNLLK